MSQLNWLNLSAGNRRLPWVCALVAAAFMLPALWTDLLVDDQIQRLPQFTESELPRNLVNTGFVPDESGRLSTVLVDLFGYLKDDEAAARARDYGIIPWWTNGRWRAALFRPFTAFTHWLDYRLFPNSPALMHAHNVAWYALVVFLTVTLYRRISREAFAGIRDPNAPPEHGRSVVLALAACLLIIDKNFYVPVMYVANRGFIISLALGLAALHAHVEWRTGTSRLWMWASAGFLLLSLLANEGGASTIAFFAAYAFVLERGGWKARLYSLVPCAAVVLGWRAVYAGLGQGVKDFVLYIDPGYQPLLFLQHLLFRANALLGGQMTGLPPEVLLALNPTWKAMLTVVFAGFNLLCAALLFPLLRRDRVARFWAVVMLLAVIPAATVFPMSKNMGFIAVGGFWVMASFLFYPGEPFQRGVFLRMLSRGLAAWLVLAHIAGALGARIVQGIVSPRIPRTFEKAVAFDLGPRADEKDVVVINDPTCVSLVVPFDRAYRGQPVPRTVRTLVPGSSRIEVSRSGPSTLILTAKGEDLFSPPALGGIHLAYALGTANELLFGKGKWRRGDEVRRENLRVEILEVSPVGLPRAVAFHFASPLESQETQWLFFDWRRFKHSEFVPPQEGERVEIPGPSSTRRDGTEGFSRRR